MRQYSRHFQISNPGARFAIGLIATMVFLCGLFWKQPILLGAGAAILCMVIQSVGETAEEQRAAAARAASRRTRRQPADGADSRQQPQVRTSTRKKSSGVPSNTSDLVNELLATGRYGLLLRRETNRHLTPDQIVRAIRAWTKPCHWSRRAK